MITEGQKQEFIALLNKFWRPWPFFDEPDPAIEKQKEDDVSTFLSTVSGNDIDELLSLKFDYSLVAGVTIKVSPIESALKNKSLGLFQLLLSHNTNFDIVFSGGNNILQLIINEIDDEQQVIEAINLVIEKVGKEKFISYLSHQNDSGDTLLHLVSSKYGSIEDHTGKIEYIGWTAVVQHVLSLCTQMNQDLSLSKLLEIGNVEGLTALDLSPAEKVKSILVQNGAKECHVDLPEFHLTIPTPTEETDQLYKREQKSARKKMRSIFQNKTYEQLTEIESKMPHIIKKKVGWELVAKSTMRLISPNNTPKKEKITIDQYTFSVVDAVDEDDYRCIVHACSDLEKFKEFANGKEGFISDAEVFASSLIDKETGALGAISIALNVPSSAIAATYMVDVVSGGSNNFILPVKQEQIFMDRREEELLTQLEQEDAHMPPHMVREQIEQLPEYTDPSSAQFATPNPLMTVEEILRTSRGYNEIILLGNKNNKYKITPAAIIIEQSFIESLTKKQDNLSESDKKMLGILQSSKLPIVMIKTNPLVFIQKLKKEDQVTYLSKHITEYTEKYKNLMINYERNREGMDSEVKIMLESALRKTRTDLSFLLDCAVDVNMLKMNPLSQPVTDSLAPRM